MYKGLSSTQNRDEMGPKVLVLKLPKCILTRQYKGIGKNFKRKEANEDYPMDHSCHFQSISAGKLSCNVKMVAG